MAGRTRWLACHHRTASANSANTATVASSNTGSYSSRRRTDTDSFCANSGATNRREHCRHPAAARLGRGEPHLPDGD